MKSQLLILLALVKSKQISPTDYFWGGIARDFLLAVYRGPIPIFIHPPNNGNTPKENIQTDLNISDVPVVAGGGVENKKSSIPWNLGGKFQQKSGISY